MIHIENNTCPICYTDNLKWNLHINKSQMHMFKCGHGCCKKCYPILIEKNVFECPMCREKGQTHYINMEGDKEWKIFAEWFHEWEIFILNGSAKNVIRNSNFGKQLIRLKKESKNAK